ncbi:MAG: Zn-dependent hydrolase [Oscillospiraceae bacterium]
MLIINEERLLERIHTLGAVGLDADGRRTRLAASDEDKAGRDLVSRWMRETGLTVVTDYIGNLFGIWVPEGCADAAPLMLGSHIDTVINAGQFDGCYGVLAALEVVETLKVSGFVPARPIAIGAFTNEEGVRYAPDMMGSLVYAGGYPLEKALASVGTDGTVLGEELRRIGYAGTVEPGFLKPCAFVELHIEQGPILDAEGISIGAVETCKAFPGSASPSKESRTMPAPRRPPTAWTRASPPQKVITFLRRRCELPDSRTVATTGCITFEPNAINVIPSRAVFTVDVRNPDAQQLCAEEQALADYLAELERTDRVKITAERLSRFDPVLFDEGIVQLIECSAAARGLSCRRMTSGAGQDAQMLARICPTAMIFVPSVRGISHNPLELTRDADLAAGANIFLDVVAQLAAKE